VPKRGFIGVSLITNASERFLPVMIRVPQGPLLAECGSP
jgi:hypothetical protein